MILARVRVTARSKSTCHQGFGSLSRACQAVAALRGITTLRADFMQTDSNGGRVAGVLSMKRPGKLRFQYAAGYPMVILSVNGERYDASAIISINPRIKLLTALISELAQPTRTWSKTGKLMVDKTPDGVASPNLADAVMMCFGYKRPPLIFSDEVLQLL